VKRHVTVHLRNGSRVDIDVRDPAELDQLIAKMSDVWSGKVPHGVLTVGGSPTFHISVNAVDMIEVM
jgi:hypothetical protein